MNKKAVLFDLDNTLYEYPRVHQKALNNVYEVLNRYINIDFDQFKYLYELSEAEIWKELIWTASSHNRVLRFQRLIEKIGYKIDSMMILDLYEAYRKIFLDNLNLREWVIDILQYLKNQWIKIVIVSNSTTHIQLRKISQLGISTYIDYLVTSEEVWSEKPQAKIFLLALNKLNMFPKDVIMVWDDLINDISWANILWIDTVLISDNYSEIQEKNMGKPKYIIRRFKDFLWIIKK